jgi:predicted DNA binding CopG/RHH family protein
MKKNNSIHIKVTSELKAKLKERASLCSMSLNSYICFVLANTTPKIQELDIK